MEGLRVASNLCSSSPLVEVPIYRVPDDILYRLFMSLTSEPSAETFDALVFLSHVCSNWRSIIVHAPLLWQFVTMHFSGSYRDHSATVESFLRRSQNQPISFAVFSRHPPFPFSTSLVFPILRRHGHRVRSLHFTTNNLLTLRAHSLICT
ncbi:hypothetical protein K438DRAFT_288457 [Mycena galopus ATCC 62051]|nr:hypothetical protein K438DRAFT_288457 [Mycena galopus ATCC 62051]